MFSEGLPLIASKRSFHRPELDVLRFLAFFMVFVHHVPLKASFVRHPVLSLIRIAGGYALCVFFLLSAYLITELLLRERESTGTVDVRAFFVRRILRIWPLYLLAIFLGFSLGRIIPIWHISHAALPYLLLMGGNVFIAHAGWKLGLIYPLWSLSIEEQFYVAIPVVARFGGKKALKLLSVSTIVVAYLALGWFGARHTPPEREVWVNSFVQFQFFAAGALLAIFLHERDWSISWFSRVTLLCSGLIAILIMERRLDLDGYSPLGPFHLCVGYGVLFLATAAVFLAFLGAPAKPPQVLVYLGKISFGLYVFHSFVLTMVFHPLYSTPRWPLARNHTLLAYGVSLAATIALASASFHLFERRILRYKDRITIVKTVPADTCG